MDSPLAKALLGKRVDDEVQITIGENMTTVSVVSIHYAT